MALNQLLKIGFVASGECHLHEDHKSIRFQLTTNLDASDILYAFVCESQVRYIGYSSRSFEKRMIGYSKPGAGQKTNLRNHQNILLCLQEGKHVSIYTLVNMHDWFLGEYRISITTGLERSLIRSLNPDWNIHGREKEVVSKLVLNKPEHTLMKPILDTIVQQQPNEYIATLGVANFNQGLLNIPVAYNDLFGENNDRVKIDLHDGKQIIPSINRKANLNGTPRIRGGVQLRDYFNRFYSADRRCLVTILNQNHIQLQPHTIVNQ